MSSFAALMAMSKAQSAASTTGIQDALAQRNAKLRAEQEEAERQRKAEQAREAKLRELRAEQERRDKERAAAREEALRAREKEAEARQQEQMQKMLGKARHTLFEKRDREGGGSPRRKKASDDDDDDSEGGKAGVFLTRAEKRALKMDPDARPQWAQQLVGTSRPGSSSSASKTSVISAQGSRSPTKSKRSGPTDFSKTLDAPSSLAVQGNPNLSIKERIKGSDYFTPIKLAAVRRDTRTQADYFQEKRLKALAAEKGASIGDKRDQAATKPKHKDIEPGRLPFGAAASRKPLTSASTSRLPSTSRQDSPAGSRKRPRSESISSSDMDLDAPRKRSKSQPKFNIWQIVTGKDRSHYQEDVFSDEEDEDMEVSAAALAKEEKRALAAAKREDQLALEEEMRHEAEKRRKKLGAR
ncbi:SubName: Full=Uncharacterized protein {ECO:0000313/EMBL:CCA69369.1} [Serendipita indica DSM 11827]|uniref:Uncharacterized protein n=1 Tax=Serendipita indica (strain DSM 11827) TaxID=1109443 RepID=G4TDG7_SERID|nr:SubName: Full=Uncharacterized protein {ECO:0000313/EMBL:CCA69369.1} [Serendipita indica DSM 11827]CCA69369.1 hypothetical protein PIIN_03268 [Serendipita indica DSM 11827]